MKSSNVTTDRNYHEDDCGLRWEWERNRKLNKYDQIIKKYYDNKKSKSASSPTRDGPGGSPSR